MNTSDVPGESPIEVCDLKDKFQQRLHQLVFARRHISLHPEAVPILQLTGIRILLTFGKCFAKSQQSIIIFTGIPGKIRGRALGKSCHKRRSQNLVSIELKLNTNIFLSSLYLKRPLTIRWKLVDLHLEVLGLSTGNFFGPSFSL